MENHLNSNLGGGQFKYIELSYEGQGVTPFKIIQDNWNTLADGTYVAKINTGSIYTSIFYRINGGQYGMVYVFGYPFINPSLMRILNGVWEESYQLITNNDFGYSMCSVNTQANVPVVIPDAPSERYGYVPVVVGHVSTNINAQDSVFYDSSKWHIVSTVSQEVYIAFYKMPY